MIAFINNTPGTVACTRPKPQDLAWPVVLDLTNLFALNPPSLFVFNPPSLFVLVCGFAKLAHDTNTDANEIAMI